MAVIAVLEDQDFLAETIRLVSTEMDFIYRGLDELGIPYFRSNANFLLIRVNKKADAVFEDLLRQGVIVRSMSSYGYPDCIRVSVGQHPENVRFLEALAKVI